MPVQSPGAQRRWVFPRPRWFSSLVAIAHRASTAMTPDAPLCPARAARSIAAANSKRRGAAVVEFAVVSPLLVLLLLGMIEVGRAMMIGEVTAGAARVGARAAVITGATNTGIANTVSSYLQAGGVRGAATTISVNGAAGVDLSAAKTGDAIQVTVQAPMEANSWVSSTFFDSKCISGTATFVKE